MSHDLRNALQVYLDVPAVQLFSDCVLCSRMWSTARRVSRGRSVTSLQMSGFRVKTVLRRPVGSLAPQRPTHELVQGMNAPSWLIHFSSHRSLPLFFPSDKRIRTNACNLPPAALRNSGTTRVGNAKLRLPPSNLFIQCTMEMWAYGRWRHQRGFSLSHIQCGETGEEIPEGRQWAGNETRAVCCPTRPCEDGIIPQLTHHHTCISSSLDMLLSRQVCCRCSQRNRPNKTQDSSFWISPFLWYHLRAYSLLLK